MLAGLQPEEEPRLLNVGAALRLGVLPRAAFGNVEAVVNRGRGVHAGARVMAQLLADLLHLAPIGGACGALLGAREQLVQRHLGARAAEVLHVDHLPRQAHHGGVTRAAVVRGEYGRRHVLACDLVHERRRPARLGGLHIERHEAVEGEHRVRGLERLGDVRPRGAGLARHGLRQARVDVPAMPARSGRGRQAILRQRAKTSREKRSEEEARARPREARGAGAKEKGERRTGEREKGRKGEREEGRKGGREKGEGEGVGGGA